MCGGEKQGRCQPDYLEISGENAECADPTDTLTPSRVTTCQWAASKSGSEIRRLSRVGRRLAQTLIVAAGIAGFGLPFGAWRGRTGQEPCRSIGSVSTQGDLIVLTLDEAPLGGANLFDLVKCTLRFTPDATGYRVENTAFVWDAEFGAEVGPRTPVALHSFAFPFSWRTWDSVTVDAMGSIGFGGSVTIGRFDQLQQAARALVDRTPAICLFLKPRLSGARHVKELSDRVVVTWNLTEPPGGIQDFAWTRTVNRFQTVLWKDGTILMSYDQIAAKDAIVGVYPPARGDPVTFAVDLSSLTRERYPRGVDRLLRDRDGTPRVDERDGQVNRRLKRRNAAARPRTISSRLRRRG